ncbi:transposase family protein [Pseudonocardia alni]|uniref:transposase family protein n=1 Tax=Pseudonocardia alni TaxID=33907 RepID=UPI00386A496B
MASGYDRAFYSGKHKAHGLNVQVIADPVGRLVWISPPMPGARHDMGAAREHGIIDALAEHEIPARPTPPTKAPVLRSPCRSGVDVRTPTPADSGSCRDTRRT